MNSIGIVTDSHSSITQEEAGRLGIRVLPMPFYIDDECFYEDVTLSREHFFERLSGGAEISTSQPSPEAVMEIWDQSLEDHEKVLYLPISSGLSGSYMTASAMAEDEKYKGRVLVVDQGQVASPMHQTVLDALELVRAGYAAEEIRRLIEAAKKNSVIYIGVQTLEHLKKGGRVTPAAAALGSVFNIKPILKMETGKLDSFKKCHGMLKARRVMIETMKEELATRFSKAYQAGAVHLLAAGSALKDETESWLSEIREAFPELPVLYDDLALGVSCHIGPGGLGIGCTVRPDFEE